MINTTIPNKSFLESSILLSKRVPFLILKPNVFSYDEAIPYLAMNLGYDLIKVGIHNIGYCVKENDALALIKESLLLPTFKNTILWIEDISPVDDKTSLVKKTIELVENRSSLFLIFTGITEMCKELTSWMPVVEWDEHLPSTKSFLWRYITPDSCSTKIVAPQALHFRVYSNIVDGLLKEFGTMPDIDIITEKDRGTFSSLISTVKLCINDGTTVQISTKYRPLKHEDIVQCLLKYWSQPVGVLYEGNKKIS